MITMMMMMIIIIIIIIIINNNNNNKNNNNNNNKSNYVIIKLIKNTKGKYFLLPGLSQKRMGLLIKKYCFLFLN